MVLKKKLEILNKITWANVYEQKDEDYWYFVFKFFMLIVYL